MPLSEKTWEPALERAIPALRLLARQRLPRPLWRRVDPSDVVQITLKEAHEKRRQFAGTSEQQLLAWLHPMLVHRLIDEIRRCKAQRQDIRLQVPLLRSLGQTSARLATELVATGRSPSQVLMNREAIDRVGQALEELPEDQRFVVEGIYLNGLKMSDVAQVLGRSTPAVAALLHRALQKLREALKGRI